LLPVFTDGNDVVDVAEPQSDQNLESDDPMNEEGLDAEPASKKVKK